MLNNPSAGMSIIVKSITRIIISLVLVFGIYIVAHGHVSPGGGFAGGVIIALSFVLLMLAFGKGVATSRITKTIALNLESVGALMFLLIALSGFLGGAFFVNILAKGVPFRLFSAGTIPLYNYVLGLKVGVGLFAIYLAFVILEKTRKRK